MTSPTVGSADAGDAQPVRGALLALTEIAVALFVRMRLTGRGEWAGRALFGVVSPPPTVASLTVEAHSCDVGLNLNRG